MNKPTFFVSYSWLDNYFADRICDDLKILGFNVIRDTDVIEYSESIPGFMKRIRKEDYVLLLVSERYIKSLNCMKEMVELKKDDYRWDVLFPIVINNSDLFNDNRLKYLEYWENRIRQKDERLRGTDPCNSACEWLEFQSEKTITQNLSDFLIELKNRLLCSPEELWSKKYKIIIERTGISSNYNVFQTKKLSNVEIEDIIKGHKNFLNESMGEPADLSRCNLVHKVLVGKDIDLSGINFKYSILASAHLVGAELVGCNLMGADLRGANLEYANLCDADLRGANLTGIKYDGIKIRKADFSYAIMDAPFKNFVLEHGGKISEIGFNAS